MVILRFIPESMLPLLFLWLLGKSRIIPFHHKWNQTSILRSKCTMYGCFKQTGHINLFQIHSKSESSLVISTKLAQIRVILVRFHPINSSVNILYQLAIGICIWQISRFRESGLRISEPLHLRGRKHTKKILQKLLPAAIATQNK